MPKWKREAKEKLRGLVAQHGSQRQLARAWLGSPARSPQVNRWVSAAHSEFPDMDNLVALRDCCGVSIDWLLSTVSAMPGTWTPDRRERLSDELTDFTLETLFEREEYLTRGSGARGADSTDRKRGAYYTARYRPVELHAFVTNEFAGDPLGYFAQEIRRLTDESLEALSRYSDYEDAKKWRRAQRAASRARPRK